jgi:hypothetical protein
VVRRRSISSGLSHLLVFALLRLDSSLFLYLTHDIIYRKENKKKEKEYRSEVGRSQQVSG